MPTYRTEIQVLFQVGDHLDNPDMVAEVWASGLVSGIQYNRPEVIGTEMMVQRVQDESGQSHPHLEEVPSPEDQPQARPELEP